MLYNLVAADRQFVLNYLNEDAKEEGFPPIELTGRAIITAKGIVWYELRDDHNYLSWATSYPFNRQRVTVATEEKEAHDFDEDVK